MQHIQGLLLLSKSIEVLVDYQISRYLNYLVDAHLCTKATSTWVHQLWVSLVPLWHILVGHNSMFQSLCDFVTFIALKQQRHHELYLIVNT